ncbi:MAG: hypothetical protein JW939_04840 [Candidatus Thermoplasmatota archaeon]|nr:hypothetical protein [Candidatus Thermoplasmatota archaeon]
MRSLFLLTVLFGVFLILPPWSSGLSEDDHYILKSSDPGREPVIEYDVPTILYQEQGVLIQVNENTETDLTVHYRVVNGTIVVLDEYDLRSIREYSEWGVNRWDGESEGLLQTTGDDDLLAYYLAPDYLDVDYEMKLRITVKNGSKEIYWEEHHFQVKGEPITIKGHDPFKEISVENVLMISFIVGALYWTLVLIMARSVSRLTGRGKK